MLCPYCHKELLDDSKYCKHCGKKIQTTDKSEVIMQPFDKVACILFLIGLVIASKLSIVFYVLTVIFALLSILRSHKKKTGHSTVAYVFLMMGIYLSLYTYASNILR